MSKSVYWLLCLVLLSQMCGSTDVASTKASIPDYWPTTDWLESSPQEQGMDPMKIIEMKNYIEEQAFDIDSIIVVRNGYIVLEEYFNFYTQDTLHQLHSVTKSFTSALIGIAIDRGFIESVELKVLDFFPNRTFVNVDSRKQSMTLKDLLTMRTGLEWDEWTYPYTDGRNSVIQMAYSGDAIQFVLDLPMVSDPGESFTYCSGASHLLGAILHQTTGSTTLEFANEYLFEPLGITNLQWTRDTQGLYYTGGGLSLTPRDMAKFGYLFLNNGTWDGEQIISADWVIESTATSLLLWDLGGYGYQWWTYPTLGIYQASGLYRQSIFVVPDYDMVVIFTADIREGSDPELGLLYHFIIPAITGDTPTSTPLGFKVLLPPMVVVLLAPIIFATVYWIVRTKKVRMDKKTV
ncbi:MAG: serine hydrolase domain-containing protein [Candidatus Hermodarchaeota archaeon]